jgi:hypothetical protein
VGERTLVIVSQNGKKGAKYHLPRCPAAQRIESKRRTTIGRAKKDGFVACRQCDPK